MSKELTELQLQKYHIDNDLQDAKKECKAIEKEKKQFEKTMIASHSRLGSGKPSALENVTSSSSKAKLESPALSKKEGLSENKIQESLTLEK